MISPNQIQFGVDQYLYLKKAKMTKNLDRIQWFRHYIL